MATAFEQGKHLLCLLLFKLSAAGAEDFEVDHLQERGVASQMRSVTASEWDG